MRKFTLVDLAGVMKSSYKANGRYICFKKQIDEQRPFSNEALKASGVERPAQYSGRLPANRLIRKSQNFCGKMAP